MSATDKAFGGVVVDGVHTRVVVSDSVCITDAVEVVRTELEAQAAVVSPVRADSELTQLNRTFGRTVPVSPTLLDHLDRAVFAAEFSSGALDFTTRDSDWRALEIAGFEVRLPDWMHIDLSATATGLAVDRAAEAAAAQLGCGVLLACADHVVAAGPEPAFGWQVEIGPDVRIGIPSGSAVVTAVGHSDLRSVTVAAPSAFLAATLSTAALQLGGDARSWLSETGMPARIVTRRGTPITTHGWPAAA